MPDLPEEPAATAESGAAPEDGSRRELPATTVGTGSAIAIGCVVAVILFVLIALAAKWLWGLW
jgi:hypothetical protein